MPDPVQSFAATLRRIRHEKAMTQDDLAQAAGMDAAEIRRLEAGKRDPGLRVLARLADGLGVSASALLG